MELCSILYAFEVVPLSYGFVGIFLDFSDRCGGRAPSALLCKHDPLDSSFFLYHRPSSHPSPVFRFMMAAQRFSSFFKESSYFKRNSNFTMLQLSSILTSSAISAVLLCCNPVQSFAPSQHLSPHTTTKLMGGFGATKSKPKSKKKKTKTTPFDVSASMSRLEKKYEKMMLASAKQIAKVDDDQPKPDAEQEDTITSEFMVAARALSKQGVHDWVPIAQLCVAYPESNYHEVESNKDILQAAVSAYCREISHVAGIGAQMFSSVARSDIQYSVEPVDSFHKHVYERVIEENKNGKKTMSKAEARTILELENDIDKTQIKQAYRRLSFALHPDRLEESADAEEAAGRFENVQAAYETLTSGVRESGKSWYESLGGRARTDFQRIELLSLSDAQCKMEEKRIHGSLMGLDPDLVQSFVVRNVRSE